MKQLKSFLGLANYFWPHVKNHAGVARRLHNMLVDYYRSKLLIWTPESEAAFRALQHLVSECPTMYFVDPDIPMYLHTDASDFGMGGYLYFCVERLCAFVSQSVSGPQLRWATIQKEVFGIFRSCQVLDPLIRDRKFLLYIAEDSDPMIARWYRALQELEFTIEHITGSLISHHVCVKTT